MKTGFIPAEVFSVCTDVVTQFHQKHGFGNLSERIAAEDNISAISRIPEASAVLDVTNKYLKVRKFCFLSCIGIVCLSFLVPWWTLSAIAAIFIADRIMLFREKDGWKFLAAVLLGLEMLSNDFSGWGKAYPQERAEATRVLKDNPDAPRSVWLEYYKPASQQASKPTS